MKTHSSDFYRWRASIDSLQASQPLYQTLGHKNKLLGRGELFQIMGISCIYNLKSLDGILELEPMSPYHRLLLHRLADIFGPSVLVSDILLEYDEYLSPTTSTQILKRKDSLPDLKLRQASLPPVTPVEEREAAYLAARERIFSLHHDDGKEPVAPKPRSVPVVARRMIAHALGQRISSTSLNLERSHSNCKEDGPTGEPIMAKESLLHSKSPSKSTKISNKTSSSQKLGSHERKANGEGISKGSAPQASQSEIKVESKPARNSHGDCSSLQTGNYARNSGIQNMEQEHLGAAKRMFAHALGLAPAKSNQSG
ncbi:hypothetical protein Taro_054054 [Colocasia esculenta]|uniref:SUZ domain-containing protein n=1 Tax=Colocasia esculenta TaxID=4460 RepID=A0A843XMQ8_COLES|nr:hypothetical protein [Colocasia esculenta]